VNEAASIRIDDAVLIQRCRRGDSEATERLILRYQNRVYNIIFRMCGNADDAAELTQDTFVKVIENIDRFAGKSSFYTWIFRIAVNITLNFCKRRTKVTYQSLDIEQQDQNWQATALLKKFLSDETSPDPALVAQNKELLRLLQESLTELDEPHRAVIVLRDIEQMTYDQIAKVLNLEMGTVKSRLNRARCNLRELLEKRLR
jgi:RNA polymerase sigma-70 factor (ECF subfamily)